MLLHAKGGAVLTDTSRVDEIDMLMTFICNLLTMHIQIPFMHWKRKRFIHGKCNY